MKRSGVAVAVLCGFLCAPSSAEEQSESYDSTTGQVETALERMRAKLDDLHDRHRQLLDELDGLSEQYSELVELLKQRAVLTEPLSEPQESTAKPTDDGAVQEEESDEQRIRSPRPVSPPAILPRGNAQTGVGAAYSSAMRYLNDGQTGLLRESLLDFLEQYPHSLYSGQANYWIGVSHYEEGDHDKAMLYFTGVVERFPDSSKYDDALLKQGDIYYQSDKITEAQSVFEKLLESDNRRVRNLARTRLEKLSGRKR